MQNLLISILGISIILNPLLPFAEKLIPKAKADLPDDYVYIEDPVGAPTDNLFSNELLVDLALFPLDKEPNKAISELFEILKKYSKTDDDALKVTLEDIFGANNTQNSGIGANAKIVLTQNDLSAVRMLSCMSKILPNYLEDFDALRRDLTAKTNKEIDQRINFEKTQNSPLFTSFKEYFYYLKFGHPDISTVKKYQNKEYLDQLVKEAQMNWGSSEELEALWIKEAERLKNGQETTTSFDNLACMAGIEVNQLRGQLLGTSGRTFLADTIKKRIEDNRVDIRVIKTIVYLVTPKDRGGAGHWRVRVSKILQQSEYSHESDAVIDLVSNNQTSTPTRTECDPDMTAAECGSYLRQREESETPDAIVETTGGEEYEAWIKETQKDEEAYLEERGLSVHKTGQALDVIEIDDIRCTLVQKRKTAIFFTASPIITKEPIKPIKLAWQTQEGWDQSRGQDEFDQMSLLKSIAEQSVYDFFASMGTDINDYDGDLSQANFNDLIGIMGQSLLAHLVDSPSISLKGYDVMSVLKNLGGIYIADYLGLPREIFENEDFLDVERVKYLIGRTAIEKRMGLPFGSLDNYNDVATKAEKKPIFDIEGMLVNIGKRKLEKEMLLRAGDLPESLDGQSMESIIGRRVIENTLSMRRNTWPIEAKSFVDLESIISKIRFMPFKTYPDQVDSLLHLDVGTTKKLMTGQINSSVYARLVGQTRILNTSAGLQHFGVNNVAYQLPEGTWEDALAGKREGYRTIGLYTLSRLLAEDFLPLYIEGDLIDDYVYSNLEGGKDGEPEEPRKNVKKEYLLTDSYNETIVYSEKTYGQYVFRKWLEESYLRVEGEACKAGRDINLDIMSERGLLLQEQINLIKNQACPLYQEINFTDIEIVERSTSDNRLLKTSGKMDFSYQDIVPISSQKATGYGLEDFDLYAMFGYKEADARTVFNRIGSKLLYYGLANQLLNTKERTKIDLFDTDPVIVAESGDLAFYVSRILKGQELIKSVSDKWKAAMNSSYPGYESMISRVNNIIKLINDSASGSDMLRTRNIIMIAREITSELAPLVQELNDLERTLRLSYNSENIALANRINSIIEDVNALIVVVSEVLAGKVIPSADTIRIGDMVPGEVEDARDRAESRRGQQKLSSLAIADLLFGFLAKEYDLTDVLVRVGANSAEAGLGLPANSLIYLVQNYQKKGINNLEAFYQAIGQARVEEEFYMPAFYFQPALIDEKMPAYNEDLNQLFSANGQEIWKELQLDEKANYYTVLDSIQEVRSNDPDKFKKWVKAAEEKWNENHRQRVAKADINDVVKNVKEKELNSKSRSPEDDLLFKMGLTTGRFEGLTSNSSVSWQGNVERATSIDDIFSLNRGMTKTLFTGEETISSASFSHKEKQLLEASNLKVGQSMFEKYIMMLNGELLPDEAEYSYDLDFTGINPYAQRAEAGDDCPITYTSDGGFYVNRNTIEADSFCYYDMKGRHCFQSFEEAQRYFRENEGDRIKDLLGYFAAKLSEIHGGLKVEEIYSRLDRFINREINAVFTKAEIDVLAEKSGLPTELLTKMFSKKVDQPVFDYLNMVGQKEAEMILSSQIFQKLNLNIDPRLFNASDFYDIFNGDFSSLTRVASHYIDVALNVPSGSTYLVYTAVTKDALNCVMAQVGGTMLGNLLGLDYFPIQGITKGNIISNIGQAKIEETFNLPRGSFRGEKVEDLIHNIGPINFIKAFKIPLLEKIPEHILVEILGQSKADGLKDASSNYVLNYLKNYLYVKPTLDEGELSALQELDYWLTSGIKIVLDKMKSTSTETLLKALSDDAKDNEVEAYNDIREFTNFLYYADTLLGIDRFSVYFMLTENNMTPNKLAVMVGEKLSGRIALTKLGEAFGLSATASEAATEILLNISKVFGNDDTCTTKRDPTTGEMREVCDYKNNWGWLYQNLDAVFNFHLDEKAKLPSGTFQRILDNPNAVFSIMLELGVARLDTMLELDSDDTRSFTFLYKMFFGGDIDDVYTTSCYSQYLYMEDELQLKLAGARRSGDTETEKRILDQLNAANSEYNLCLQRNRDAGELSKGELVWNWAIVEIAKEVKTLLSDVKFDGRDVGVNVPIDDIHNFLRGDLRFMAVIMISLGVNIVLSSDPEVRNNCNPEYVSGGQCQTSLPPELMITYEDVRNAIFGSPEYHSSGAAAATAEVAAGTYLPPDPDRVTNSDDMPSLEEMRSGQIENGLEPIRPFDYDQQLMDDIIAKTQYQSTLSTIWQNLKKAWGDWLQYKMMDIALWQLDSNVFPGFSKSLLTGNAQERGYALEKFIVRGLESGYLLGVKFDAVKDAEGWLAVYKFIFEGGGIYNAANFEKFVGNGGFDFLSGFISKEMSRIFKLNIPTEMAGGLLLGISTGNWGFSGCKGTDCFLDNDSSVKFGDREIPTLGNVVSNWGLSKLFGWFDDWVGWKPGTSYAVFKMTYDIFKYTAAYNAAKNAIILAESAEELKKAEDLLDAQGKLLAQAYLAAIKFAVDLLLDSLLGEVFADIEMSLGLAPGSIHTLVSGTIVSTVVNSTPFLDKFLSGPAIFWAAVAMFVIMNLWTRVVRVEYWCSADGYYPYYPDDSEFPNYSSNDISDIGVFGGDITDPKRSEAVNKTIQDKFQESAQYKARRLIGDTLIMQNSPIFNDSSGDPTVPIQIMTGRKEDVEYWDQLVSRNMCRARLGEGAVSCGGICGSITRNGGCSGDTRMGIWQNPQTTAWTHIGF